MRTLYARLLAVALGTIAIGSSAHAALLLSEGFESLPTLQANTAWTFSNLSTSPSTNLWRQGSADSTNSIGPAPAGTPTSYAVANYTDTSSTAATGATISQWMITPVLTYTNGTTVSFFSRTGTGAAFPDRLEVRLSTNGASSNIGATPTSVGDFTTVLLSINPTLLTGATNYPDTWTQFTATVSGLSVPTSGRVAFRYFVTNAGTNGANSNIVGVDTLAINSPTVVPEAGSLTLILPALGLVGAVVLRRRK